MKPEKLIRSLLNRTGRTCPGCERESLTPKNVEGTANRAIGQLWCPVCGWSINVFVDGDGMYPNFGQRKPVTR